MPNQTLVYNYILLLKENDTIASMVMKQVKL